MKNNLGNFTNIFKKFPSLKLVYLFGSQAKNQTGPLSDYDFAIYLDEKNVQKRFDISLKIQTKLCRQLKTDAIDMVILNDTASPELKYNIIKDGRLLYQKAPFKVLIEPAILNEYFDFYESLHRYQLTKALI